MHKEVSVMSNSLMSMMLKFIRTDGTKMKKYALVLAAFLFLPIISSPPSIFAATHAIQVLQYPGSSQTYPQGINNQGHIVGFTQTCPPGGQCYPDVNWLYDGTGFTIISSGVPGNINNSVLMDINNNGQVLDISALSYPDAQYTGSLAFSDNGQIVGYYLYGDFAHGFSYDGSYRTIDYPGQTYTFIRGVNDQGVMVGEYQSTTPVRFYSFIYNGYDFQSLTFPGAIDVRAAGINNLGTVVGSYYDDSIGRSRGFIYDGANFETIDMDASEWGNVYLTGINDFGQIVGQAEPLGGPSVVGILLTPAQIPVDINIRPWSRRNPINYKGHGILPVAILSTEDFDAPTQVDRNSLTFGTTGNEKSLAFCNPKPKNVSRDSSRDDLVCHFYVEVAGFKCGDTEGIIKGKTLSGVPIEGEDMVRITNCK
jgi:uncharacterized membrane protein